MKRLLTKKIILFFTPITLFFVAPITTHANIISAAANAIISAIDPLSWIGRALELLILPLAAIVMRLTGYLFDLAVRFSLGTGYVFSNMTVINESWATIRDICNLFFIFALIWISISIILSLSGFNTKRHLTQLIVAALIINFSLYFTKVFVDVSNIFGVWLYNGLLKSLEATNSSSLSALIAAKLEVFYMWQNIDAETLIAAGKSLVSGSIYNAIIRLLVVLTATYVFMYTAILFITRAITIIFLLILSPIGFIGGLLPQVDEYSKQWWKELVDAVTFPIVYLLMLFITSQLISNMDGSAWAGLFTGNNNVLFGIDTGKTFKFIIVIAALLICLKVAKDSAGQLGKAASGIAGGLSKLSTAVGGGGAALVGQYTLGAGAARLANNKKLNEIVAGGGITGAVASGVKGQLNSAADFHFDPRTTISEFGVKGGKGYVARRKEQMKDQEQSIKDLAPSKEDLSTAKSMIELAEDRVYKKHQKFGGLYDEKKATIKTNTDILNNPSSTPSEKEAALKALNKAKNDLGDVKKIIEDDKEFKDAAGLNASDAIYNEKIKMMELADKAAEKARKEGRVRDAEAQEKKRDAMNETLRQERAARAAATGPLVSVAKPFNKSFKEMSVGAKIATVATGGITMAAGQQIVRDSDKESKKLREIIASKGKEEQDKITKMLAKMASGGEDTPAPTPPPAAPTPPSGGGGPTTP